MRMRLKRSGTDQRLAATLRTMFKEVMAVFSLPQACSLGCIACSHMILTSFSNGVCSQHQATPGKPDALQPGQDNVKAPGS